MGSPGAVRSLHMAVKFDSDVSAAEEANRKFSDMKVHGDKAAASINNVEKEMAEYAKKIGLTKNQLDALAKTKLRDNQINDFAKQFGVASSEVKKLATESENASGKLGRVGAAFKAFAAGIALAGAITFMGGMLKSAASFEQTSMSFEVMLGSADKAKSVLNELNQFSIKTPFEPKEVNASAQALLQYKVAQEDLIPLMNTIGDVASGTGKSYEDLARMVGKAHALDKADNEMLQQMPVLYGALADSMGVTEKQVFDMASSGQINFKTLEKSLQGLTSAGGIFFGSMDKQSKTFTGIMSTVTGNIDEIKKSLGEMLLNALKPFLNTAGEFLSWLLKSPVAMGILKTVFVAIIPVIGVLAVGAVMSLVSAFGSLAISMIAALWPVYVIIAVVMALILIIEDLYTWLTGGESVIGKWIDKGGVLGTVLKVLFAPLTFIAWLIKNIIGLATGGPAAFSGFFGVIKNGVLAIYEFLKKYGKFFVMAIFPLSALYVYWDEIKSFFSRAVSGLISMISTYGKYIVMALFPVSALYVYWDEISAWFKSLPDKIVEFFAGIPAKLKTLFSDIAPAWLQKGISIFAESKPEIAGARANGGDVEAGKLYRVNENNREYFRPTVSGTVIPLGSGKESSKSAIFAPVINISVGSGDPGAIAQAVKDVLYTLFNDSRSSLGLQEG